MKKHIFLTGEIQIGKSTVIAKTLTLLSLIPGGFRTLKIDHPEMGNSDIIIYSARATPESGQIVAHKTQKSKTVFPEIFNTYGSSYLKQPSELILMDELGYLENEAEIFQNTVFKILNNTIPVLGVVRHKETDFLNAIRHHPHVITITVTEKNRNSLPEKLAAFYKKEIKMGMN